MTESAAEFRRVGPGVSSDRQALLQRGLRLELFTISWNVIEAIVAIAAGVAAGSIALIGFGLDSVIEVIAASALYARLRGELSAAGSGEGAERRALGIVAVTFFLLAAYVGYESFSKLATREHPAGSLIGIALSAVSLVVMPFLATKKLRVGRDLGSRALVADSKETFACASLSLTLLVGLALNATLGWWWADPIAALIMLPFIAREGWEAWEGSREGDAEG